MTFVNCPITPEMTDINFFVKNITEKYLNFKSVVTFVLIVRFGRDLFDEKIISRTIPLLSSAHLCFWHAT